MLRMPKANRHWTRPFLTALNIAYPSSCLPNVRPGSAFCCHPHAEHAGYHHARMPKASCCSIKPFLTTLHIAYPDTLTPAHCCVQIHMLSARGACGLLWSGSVFELFDPEAEVGIHRGKLPHWYQPGVTHFITFRTADSVPRSVQGRWHAERDEWLRKHGIDPDNNWQRELERHGELQRDYHKTFTRAFGADYLDRGLRQRTAAHLRQAAVVGQALHEFDGDRYELSDLVVMPNPCM